MLLHLLTTGIGNWIWRDGFSFWILGGSRGVAVGEKAETRHRSDVQYGIITLAGRRLYTRPATGQGAWDWKPRSGSIALDGPAFCVRMLKKCGLGLGLCQAVYRGTCIFVRPYINV